MYIKRKSKSQNLFFERTYEKFGSKDICKTIQEKHTKLQYQKLKEKHQQSA